MKKILVLGSSGMLGHVATLRFQESGHEVFGLSKSRKFGNLSILLDISSIEKFNFFLDNNFFDVIVNCVALLVVQSDKYKDLAVYLNAYIPHFLEMKYKDTNTKIIHVGTDGIFSGESAPYSENAMHDSGHFYGKSKYLGEINNAKDLTVRSAFWGPDLNRSSANLFNWILNQNNTINGFTNQIFNGVSSLEFADFLDIAIRYDITGIFHLTAKKPISKCDFLLSVKKVFGLKNEIIPAKAQNIDRTLANGRADIPYATADYAEMLTDCRKWIQDNRELYPHYSIT
ncbi:MAG: sugar nucleotide-binding protein [Deferribacteraceae bacterium]|jgi:dTDP-4-dehydrorhamnose reductase|nr:sugar nucleotide-binding protein [Deferribacteraceae bacterium]